MYQQYKPHIALQDYIDAYWISKSDSRDAIIETILPDGCVDIIMNTGADCSSDNSRLILQNEKAYLVGTMTRFTKTTINPNTHLLGIRFKPAAFSLFFKFASLHEITDNTIEFDTTLLSLLQRRNIYSLDDINQFFLNRLIQPKHVLLPVINDIRRGSGQVTIPDLAKRHFITERQLERSFKQHVGISPKSFIRLVRYQCVTKAIQNRSPQQSLMDIAFEHGYYDHSHLSRELKQYTGKAPSQF